MLALRPKRRETRTKDSSGPDRNATGAPARREPGDHTRGDAPSGTINIRSTRTPAYRPQPSARWRSRDQISGPRERGISRRCAKPAAPETETDGVDATDPHAVLSALRSALDVRDAF